MIKMKTTPKSINYGTLINTIKDPERRSDCWRLVDIMKEVSNEEPIVWGDSIIGFGNCHYRYKSGREGDTMKIGFASRKGHISIYGAIFYDNNNTDLLDRLGIYKKGKGCLYIKKLKDIKADVLNMLIKRGYLLNNLNC